MTNKKHSTASRLRRCMKAPVRVFCRACDFYVRGITSCAGKVQRGGGGGAFYPPVTTLPRSFSVQSARTSTSGDEDLRELIRAASVSRRDVGMAAPMVVPRSHSVAVGRIDEDKPCEFEDDVRLGADYMFPRSRSYAMTGKRRAGAFA